MQAQQPEQHAIPAGLLSALASLVEQLHDKKAPTNVARQIG